MLHSFQLTKVTVQELTHQNNRRQAVTWQISDSAIISLSRHALQVALREMIVHGLGELIVSEFNHHLCLCISGYQVTVLTGTYACIHMDYHCNRTPTLILHQVCVSVSDGTDSTYTWLVTDLAGHKLG